MGSCLWFATEHLNGITLAKQVSMRLLLTTATVQNPYNMSQRLQFQQTSLNDHCADLRSSSSPVPSQSMPVDADLEMEPVSPNQGIRPSNHQGVDEATVNDSHSPESLQHESDTLQFQQTSLDDHCADLRSSSSPIPSQSMPVDADLEMEPVSPNQGIRPSNHPGVDDATVNDSHSPESLQHESESLQFQLTSLDDHCADLRLRSSSPISSQSMPVDTDLEMEPVSPSHRIRPSNPQGVDEATGNDSHSPESLQHESDTLQFQQTSLDDHCADLKSKGSSSIPLQSMPVDNDLEMEPVSPNQGIRPSNPQGAGETTVGDNHSPESLQHRSETLQLQQTSLDDHCADLKSRSYIAIPLISMPVDTDLETEPVSLRHGFRPSNRQDRDGGAFNVHEGMGDHLSDSEDCDSDDDPAYIPDTDCDASESESSETEHATRKSFVNFGPAISTSGVDEATVNDSHSPESLQHESENLQFQQTSLGNYCGDLRSRSSSPIPSQSMPVDADLEMEPVRPSHRIRPSNLQGVDEATVNDSHSPESLQHESENLQFQQTSLGNYCGDLRSRSSSPIPSQSMPVDADLEMEPVRPSHRIRPSNPQGVDEATVYDSHSPESLQHESETLQLQQTNLDDHCADLKGSSPIPPQSMPVDADLEMEPVRPSHRIRPSNPQVKRSWRRIYSDCHSDEELTGSADPCTITARRGMKRKWNGEENDLFVKVFKEEITLKKMPTGGKILQAQKMLNRTVAQIRTRVHNMINGKQKVNLKI